MQPGVEWVAQQSPVPVVPPLPMVPPVPRPPAVPKVPEAPKLPPVPSAPAVPPLPMQLAGSGGGPGGSCIGRGRQIANWLLLAGSFALARHSSLLSQPRSAHTPSMQPRKLNSDAVSHSMSELHET